MITNKSYEGKYMKQKAKAEKTWQLIKEGKLKTLPQCMEENNESNNRSE
jgi:hypothetical protein